MITFEGVDINAPFGLFTDRIRSMPRGAGTRQCRVSVLSFCICLTRIIDQLLELCGVIIGVFFSSSTWTPLVQSSVSLFSFAHESARLSLCFPIRCCTSSHVASRGGEPELENIAASFFPHGFIFCCVPLFSLCLSCFLQWRVWGGSRWGGGGGARNPSLQTLPDAALFAF